MTRKFCLESFPLIGAAAALALLAGCATDEQPAASSAAATVPDSVILAAQSGADAAARIRTDVEWLADDAREGREAGTPGYDAAAAYFSQRLAGLGVEPGAKDEGWYQPVPLLVSVRDVDAGALSITSPTGETTDLTPIDDFLSFSGNGNPVYGVKSVPAIFVGFGVHAPEDGHDDFAGLDLAGKAVVYLSGAPDFFDSEKRAHYGSGALKSQMASERGAVAVIALTTMAGDARTPWSRRIANPTRPSMTWVHPDGEPNVSGPNIQAGAVINSEKAELLFAGAEKTFEQVRAEADKEGGAPKGFVLPARITIAGATKQTRLESPNVVGVIKGSDPGLANEYVVMTAHLDHIGVNEKLIAEGKDGINNGAMDNALGIAVMLDVARELIANPPSRSVIVLAVTAEEKGLLGAGYYAEFPTVPRQSIVANVNLDMPLMLHSFTDVVAFGAERSTLGPVVRAAANDADIVLSPDPMPELGIFTRSDHYRFVQKGIPAVYLFPGFGNGGGDNFQTFMATHYHKPSDDPSLPIMYEDVARFSTLNAAIVRQIADMDEAPQWNEGDFFGDLFSVAGEK